MLADFEAHGSDWEIPESRTSIDQVTEGLADYMVSEWEARHKEEKKSPTPLKVGDLPKHIAEYLVSEYDHDSVESVATMTVHGLRKDLAP